MVLPTDSVQRNENEMTITRPHQVTASTVEVGDVLRTGYGTLNIVDREVSDVQRWTTENGYTNARLTFTNGDTEILWAGTYAENQVYYAQRGTETPVERQDRLARDYGVQESGMPVDHEYHQGVSYDNQMSLSEVAARGGRVSRVRILKEGGRCDISYIHATLRDGTVVPLYLDMPSSGIGRP